MAWESIYILDQKVYRVHNGPNFILRHCFMKNIYKNIKMLLTVRSMYTYISHYEFRDTYAFDQN